MASFLDKIKARTALVPQHRFDLSSDHVTTTDFFQFSPIYVRELCPKSKLDVSVESLTRLAPLPQPTFGTMLVHNRAFFVPFRTVWRPFNAFITNSSYVSSTGVSTFTQVPTVNVGVLIQFLKLISTVITPTPTVYDWSDGTDFYKVYDRLRFKILESLGYKVNMSAKGVEFSLLPVLCAARVYLDWFAPTQYVANSQFFLEIQSILNRDYYYSITFSDFNKLMGLFSFGTNYDSDLFTSAWDNPNAPSVGDYANSPLSFTDNVVTGASASTTNLGAQLSANSSGQFSQFAVDALKKLSDYLKRHQLVGSRVVDRYLARFGVSLSPDKLERSIHLGSQTSVIHTGEVVANSDTYDSSTTSGAVLGGYAGIGMGHDQSSFSCETDEYGMFIIINSITPRIGYVQGIDKHVAHVNRSDFYTPEFDALGSAPIRGDEVFVPFGSDYAVGFAGLSSQVFGFLPRYYEYKTSRDYMTGDFRLNTLNAGSEAYHLFRLFNKNTFTLQASNVVHGFSFVQSRDKAQYDRVFYNVSSDADHFNCIHRFKVSLLAPMKALFDTYDFDENQGQEVTLEVNGVKAN